MKNMTIKTKISISVLIISIFSSMITGCFMFINYKNNLEEYMGKRAFDLASTVSVNINGDDIKRYNETGETDDKYQELLDYLSNVKGSTNLTYLYVMVDAGEDYKYIAEGFLDESEDPAVLGDTESKDTYGEEPAQVIAEGKAKYTSVYANGEWGNLVSGFAPVFDSNGETVGVVGLDISADAINKSIMGYLPVLIGIMLLSCALSYVLIYIVVNIMVVHPVKALEKTALKLAEGEFDISLSDKYLNKTDELGNLAGACHRMSSNMKNITDDISAVLSDMAEMNLTACTNAEYNGDFRPIKESIIKISRELNATLYSITKAAEQVKTGSEQVSDSAQTLSAGASEQAGSIEEFSASINNVSDQANENIENVTLAKSYVEQAGSGVIHSNKQMDKMLSAMTDIENSSNEISKIIKVIDDIAFQTNILALNAAVEAARAGSAGKGFAVVADEVRNLASKSADAARQTTALIENSIDIVKNGAVIAEQTAAALAEVGEKTSLVSETMEKIAKGSIGQASAIAQINSGVDQISAVVQANSATAEESAAISEELSGQANILRGEIGKFRLKAAR